MGHQVLEGDRLWIGIRDTKVEIGVDILVQEGLQFGGIGGALLLCWRSGYIPARGGPVFWPMADSLVDSGITRANMTGTDIAMHFLMLSRRFILRLIEEHLLYPGGSSAPLCYATRLV
jgi:hypothetical protein